MITSKVYLFATALLVCTEVCAGIVYSNITISSYTSVDKSNRVVYASSSNFMYSLSAPSITGYTYSAYNVTNVSPGGTITNVYTSINSVPIYAYSKTNVSYGTIQLTDNTVYEQFRSDITNIWITLPSKEYVNRIVLRDNWVQIELTQRISETTLVIPWSRVSSIKGPVSQFVEWPYGDR